MDAVAEDRVARNNRLRWHCRRALLELDLIFTRFWERRGALLDVETEDALRTLLAMEDHDLWALISGKVTDSESSPAREALIAELRRVDE